MALEDKFDGLQRLVQLGKEKGYVLYDEVSEVLPGDLPGGNELEDVLAGLDVAGIEILEEPKDFDKKLDETEEPFDLDLPAGVGEKVNDPLSMYLNDVYTLPASLAGIPAMSVPCAPTRAGLPVGLHIMARPLDEKTMLAVAAAWEARSPSRSIGPDLRWPAA